MKNTTPYYLSNNDEVFNLKKEVGKYVKFWPWFFCSSILFFSLGYLYLKYTPVTYKTIGKIKILDDSSKAMELPGDFTSLFESSKVNLENEIEVIKSHRLLEKVTKSLDLNVSYIEKGKIKDKEIWQPPFKVFDIDSVNKKTERFIIEILNSGYKISDNIGKNWLIPQYEMHSKPFQDLPFTIERNPNAKRNLENAKGKIYEVTFRPVSKATAEVSSSLSVSQVGKNSDILQLSMISPNNSKSEAIINEVIKQFNLDGILDRQLVSQRTIDFVDERFVYLTKELDSIENSKKGFKQKNQLSDIRLDTEFNIAKKSNTEQEVLDLETQLEMSKVLQKTIEQQEDFYLLPTNVGIEHKGINSLIDEFNNDVSYKNRIGEVAGSENPIIKNLKNKLIGKKINILNSIKTYQRQTRISIQKADKQKEKTSGFFSKIPQKAKILRAIERQQKIKETLYIILLEKREEAAINLAITSPSIKIVDTAITNSQPISPRKSSTYFIALSVGFGIPLVFTYIFFFVDSKIRSKDDLINGHNLSPIIGEIPFSKNVSIVKGKTDRSILSESFKVLRTNLNHYLYKNDVQNLNTEKKVIFVTSTVKGEGKTFISSNLALSYLNLNKKVLLLGADFRNPQIHNHFDISRIELGLSDYLDGPKRDIDDIIMKHKLEGNLFLDILVTGKIPPNPDELLAGNSFRELVNSLKKKYDYIIVDTAPTILVTDTIIISPLADMTIYVIRSGFSDKKLLPYIEELSTSKKLKNLHFVLNGLQPNRINGYSYNYGYNYGYSNNKKQSLISKTWNYIKPKRDDY